MTSGTTMAEIAALIGDPGRSNMLGALLSGVAHAVLDQRRLRLFVLGFAIVSGVVLIVHR